MDPEDIEAATNQDDGLVGDVYGDLDDDFTEEQFLKTRASQEDELKGSEEEEEEDEPVVKSKKKRTIVSDDENSNEAENAVGEDDEPMTLEEELERELLAEEEVSKGSVKIRTTIKEVPATQEDREDRAMNDDLDGDMNSDLDDLTDIGKLKARYDPVIFGEEASEVGSKPEVVKMVEEKSHAQGPFQPCSTPGKLSESFMKWNEIGIVRRFRSSEEKDEETIDVEFHDQDVHHSIHHVNREDFSIADLSSEALVLGSQKTGGGVSSLLYCYNFITWDDSNKEWKCDLPENEFIEGMALGSGFISISSDKGFIRIFTIGGIQTYFFSIPGPSVALAAQEQSLLITYHAGVGVRKSQNLSMYLLKIDHKTTNLPKQTMSNSVPVSLSPSSTLAWIGFTDEGTPCALDSDGILRLYKHMIGNTWIPVVNFKENVNNKADNYWVIGLSEVQEQIRCIFCKGAKYPAVIPRPQVGIVNFELPFCQRNTTKGKNEERYIRAKMSNLLLEKLLSDGFSVENQCRQSMTLLIQSLLKIFAMAITSNCEALAYEVSRMMPPLGIESAIKYALQRKCTALAEKMREVAQEKMREESVFLEEEEDEVYETIPSSSSTALADRPEESVLRPKPLSFGKKKRQESDDDVQALMRPKNGPLPSRNDAKNGSLPLRNDAKNGPLPSRNDAKNGKRKEREDGFLAFFDDIRDTLADDNPGMNEDQLIQLAREGYDAMNEEDKNEWTSKKTRVQ